MNATRRAPAKVNLFLDVVAQRPDGYHDIQTVFLPIPALADTVSVAVAAHAENAITLTCDDPDLPTDASNLCCRAAAAFAAAVPTARGCRIALTKRIPVAAGLGGGSSDAAAVLLALNDLAGRPLPGPDLAALARSLGADVPFFLDPRPSLASGIGDVLTPIACTLDAGVVLVNPRFPVSAAWAYANLARCPRSPPPALSTLLAALALGDLATTAATAYNALDPAVRDKFPLLDRIRDCLLDGGCLAAMVSGSGPTVFGLCPPRVTATAGDLVQGRFGTAVRVVTATVPSCPPA
jgi:4-diphosphocytidyl-2-C-methyl-D-erythritol kinase